MADADGWSLESIFPGTSKIGCTVPGFSRTLPTPLKPIFAANEGLITNWSLQSVSSELRMCIWCEIPRVRFSSVHPLNPLNPLFPECLVLRKPKHADFMHSRFCITATAIGNAQTHLFQIFHKIYKHPT